ncbi:riboflavin synthase [Paramaledivibacter caminithermalis]|jgi:riboflavin synthase|uniref:Riboflavin synthase n=1 Tax=Paramaledivibacter caminithermalis (strain DSM 15212 / CIP 107654 / DViRD3) TaxID=1121301 RepID=A0A1M6T075_PARC5|nr:riboflavin synthase [Paramaledivibacter caminithermalis]SHK50361.1 riboflavin synthase alpha chain [Paramaledivibacter caminithermalis DSM 15212]
MFTGLVEEVGIVQSVLKGIKSAKIVIKANKVLEDVKLGDSISTNGVCLTVTDFKDNTFSVDIMAETMRRSTLKNLIPGSKVNLERALRLDDRLGGHLVSGHIDGTGLISSLDREDNAVWVTIKPSTDLLKYIIHKGSIAIDGISLTVAYVDEKVFKVSIIPHTKDVTTLLDKSIGDEVNLECDMIGKYIEKLINFNRKTNNAKNSIDMEFLSKHGFC